MAANHCSNTNQGGRSSALLHMTKLDDFAEWACARGWRREQTKGEYEVLRLRQGAACLCYFQRSGTEHATSYGLGLDLVERWLRARTDERAARTQPGLRNGRAVG